MASNQAKGTLKDARLTAIAHNTIKPHGDPYLSPVSSDNGAFIVEGRVVGGGEGRVVGGGEGKVVGGGKGE